MSMYVYVCMCSELHYIIMQRSTVLLINWELQTVHSPGSAATASSRSVWGANEVGVALES